MMNAKEELLVAYSYYFMCGTEIKCAHIEHKDYDNDKKKVVILPVDHSSKDLEKFFNELDFEYYDSYGLQELSGTVWLKDGTWFSREEYDGDEWWRHNKIPEIPEELFKK
jgi:hypothetical protein